MKGSMEGDFPSPEVPHREPLKCSPTALSSLSSQATALLEILGEPVLHRLVEVLRRGQVETIFLVVDDRYRDHEAVRSLKSQRVQILAAPAQALPSLVEIAVKRCADYGAQNVILMETSAYVELDVNDLVHEHQSGGQQITVAYDEFGPLQVAIVNSADREVAATWTERKFLYPQHTARYLHRAYVNRLENARDLRQLAKDALQHRCRIRPNGEEVRPGVWVANSAHVHSTARLIGPAYLGPNSRLRSGAMVTNCSAVERNCIVERGTLVNDSSILCGTYVGIYLDLSHAVVNQNRLADVQRNVGIEIGDSLIGSTSLSTKNIAPGLWASVTSKGGSSVRSVRGTFRTLLPKRAPGPAPAPSRVAYAPAKTWGSLKSFSGSDSTSI